MIQGTLYAHYPTKKKNQLLTVRLAPDHVEIFRELKNKYPALSGVKFFRHIEGVSGVAKDAAKKHSGHRTNKAFDRYCQMEEKESSDMAQFIIRRKTGADGLEFKEKSE